MARLNSDHLANLLPIEPALPDFSPAAISPAIEPFDLFLQRAGRPAEPAPSVERPEPRQSSPDREQETRDPVRRQETEPYRPERGTSEPADSQGPRRESSKANESTTDVDRNGPEDSESGAASASSKAEGESDNKVEEKTDAEAASGAVTEGEEEEADEGVEFAVATVTDTVTDDSADVELAGLSSDVEGTAPAEEEGRGDDDRKEGQAKQKSAATSNSVKGNETESTEPTAGQSDKPVESRAEVAETSEADLSTEKQDGTQPRRDASADDEPEPAGAVALSSEKSGTAESDAPAADDLAEGNDDPTGSERNGRDRSRKQAGRQTAAAATGRPSGDGAGGATESDVSATSAVERAGLPAEPTRSDLGPVVSEVTGPQVAETAEKTTSRGKSEIESALGRVVSNENARSAAASGEESSGVNQSDRVRFVQRVARAFQSIGDRGGSIRLRLNPPELGSLSVEITVRNGILAARLEAETSTARAMLLDNLPALRERLAEQNIKVDSFDVELMDQSLSGSPERSGDQAQPDGDSRGGDPPFVNKQEKEREAPRQVRTAGLSGEGSRLDVVI